MSVMLRSMKESRKSRKSLRKQQVKSLRMQFQRYAPECPQVVKEVCEHIETHGTKVEGILRVSGTHREVAILKEKYAAGKRNINLNDYNIHSAGSLLSQYFSELPNPVFTFEMYDLWMATMSLTPAPLLVECLRHTISLLPPGNRITLVRTLKMFRAVMDDYEFNKMSPQNIAIAFTPSLIRPEIETIETLVAHGETSQKLLALMIELFDELFEVPPEMELPDNTPELYIEIFEEAKEFLALTQSTSIDFSGEEPFELEVSDSDEYEIPEEERPIVLIQVRSFFRDLNVKYQLQYNTGIWELMRRESNFIWAVKKDVRDFESKIDTINCTLSKLVEREAKTKVEEWQSKLAETEVKTIMANLKAILEVHNMILEEITDVWRVINGVSVPSALFNRRDCSSTWPLVRRVGELLLGKVQLFIVYNAYVDMYIRLQRRLFALDANPALKQWMKQTVGKRGERGMARTLEDLVLLPFKHLSGWIQPLQKLLLAAITYKEDMRDQKDLVQAYAIMSRMAVFVDTLSLWTESEALQAVETRVVELPSYWKTGRGIRRLIAEANCNIASEGRTVFLFSDHIMVTKKSKKRLKYCYHLNLDDCTGIDPGTKANAFRVEHTDRVYAVALKSHDEKLRWVSLLQAALASSTGFGVALNRMMTVQSQKFPELKLPVPRVLQVMVQFLRQEREISEAELCLHGDPYAISSLRMKFESLGPDGAAVHLCEFSNADIIGTIKHWLVRLPEPIIVQEQMPLNKLFKDKDHTIPNIENFVLFVYGLGTYERAVLQYIMRFLQSLPASPTLLGYTWAQCFIRPRAQAIDTSLKVLAVSQVVSILIQEYTPVFTSKPKLQKLQGGAGGSSPSSTSALRQRARTSTPPVKLSHAQSSGSVQRRTVGPRVAPSSSEAGVGVELVEASAISPRSGRSIGSVGSVVGSLKRSLSNDAIPSYDIDEEF